MRSLKSGICIKGEVILRISEDLTLFFPLDVYSALLWNTEALVEYLNILEELGNGIKPPPGTESTLGLP